METDEEMIERMLPAALKTVLKEPEFRDILRGRVQEPIGK
jgi:hypothetical protein